MKKNTIRAWGGVQNGTPLWDREHRDRLTWFQGTFGKDAVPNDIFEVFVHAEGNRVYSPKGTQHGFILWALEWMMCKKELSIIPVAPGKVDEYIMHSEDYSAVLESFREHGEYKKMHLEDEECHPFIHHLLHACQYGSELTVRRRIDESVVRNIIKIA